MAILMAFLRSKRFMDRKKGADLQHKAGVEGMAGWNRCRDKVRVRNKQASGSWERRGAVYRRRRPQFGAEGVLTGTSVQQIHFDISLRTLGSAIDRRQPFSPSHPHGSTI